MLLVLLLCTCCVMTTCRSMTTSRSMTSHRSMTTSMCTHPGIFQFKVSLVTISLIFLASIQSNGKKALINQPHHRKLNASHCYFLSKSTLILRSMEHFLKVNQYIKNFDDIRIDAIRVFIFGLILYSVLTFYMIGITFCTSLLILGSLT